MIGYGAVLNTLSANFTKWPNTLKQFVGNLPTHFLSVFGHFVGLSLKGLCNLLIVIAFKESKKKIGNVDINT